MSDAMTRAHAFLSEEKAFRLGDLITESVHPRTQSLSQTLQSDIEAGIRMLQSVDQDIVTALDRLFHQPSFAALVQALFQAMMGGRQIFFTGCGATGRLSILLEAVWRQFWQEAESLFPELKDLCAAQQERCISIMAGGDFALIKSVEGFEDFPAFGRMQLQQAGVATGDVVVAITEGGETPFVIGTAWQGLASGANVFFVYNNPTDVLHRHVLRSREIIDEPRITKLDLTTGPMAITGSTRMQAVTTELLVVGAALEMSLAQFLQSHLPQSELIQRMLAESSVDVYCRRFKQLIQSLSGSEVVDTIARATRFEADLYAERGLVTYLAHGSMLDVLTDTTERSPTFMVPPFRQRSDTHAPVSWAFVKHPFYTTPRAWHHILQREPRGLAWDQNMYRQLNAPAVLRDRAPRLDNQAIYQFCIGNEPDSSRTQGSASAGVIVGFSDGIRGLVSDKERLNEPYRQTAVLSIGHPIHHDKIDQDLHFHCPCALPASPLRLWKHLAVKLILNTLSTATMTLMNRVTGNAMTWVSPSNKKLIDRACRLIVLTAGCTYERACEVLFEMMEQTEQNAQEGKETRSPVALAIEQLSG